MALLHAASNMQRSVAPTDINLLCLQLYVSSVQMNLCTAMYFESEDMICIDVSIVIRRHEPQLGVKHVLQCLGRHRCLKAVPLDFEHIYHVAPACGHRGGHHLGQELEISQLRIQRS